jgi:hypothetical protein
MDRAVDPAAAEERLVRGVDDGVDVERRDVSENRAQMRRHCVRLP